MSVADVDRGIIHLNDPGIATITVRNSKNEIAKCKVVVLEKKPELSIINDSSDVSSSEDSDYSESPQSQSNPIVFILLFVFLAVVIIVIIAIVIIRKKQKRKHTTI